MLLSAGYTAKQPGSFSKLLVPGFYSRLVKPESPGAEPVMDIFFKNSPIDFHMQLILKTHGLDYNSSSRDGVGVELESF